jgi:hypothetical protein
MADLRLVSTPSESSGRPVGPKPPTVGALLAGFDRLPTKPTSDQLVEALRTITSRRADIDLALHIVLAPELRRRLLGCGLLSIPEVEVVTKAVLSPQLVRASEFEGRQDKERVAIDEDEIRFLDDIANDPLPEPVVEGMIYAGCLSVVTAEPGTGKGFKVLDLGSAMRQPTPGEWFGLRCQQGSMLIVLFERDALSKRARALRKAGKAFDNVLIWRPRGLALSPVKDKDGNYSSSAGERILKEQIRRLQSRLEKLGRPPLRVVVIDTLARANADDESNESLNRLCGALRRVLDGAPNIGMLLTHHPRVDTGKASALPEGASPKADKGPRLGKGERPRGGGALTGDVEVSVYLRATRTDGDSVFLELSGLKDRDNGPLPPVRFIRRRVMLGETDVLGNEASSCVIEADLRDGEGLAQEEATTLQMAVEQAREAIDQAVLRSLREAHLANPGKPFTSRRALAKAAGIRSDEVAASEERLMHRGLLILPERKRQPYAITEKGLTECG